MVLYNFCDSAAGMESKGLNNSREDLPISREVHVISRGSHGISRKVGIKSRNEPWISRDVHLFHNVLYLY